MKPVVQYALLAAGGVLLLGGSFVTFAALSGTPLHEVAILKSFVHAPETPSSGESAAHAPVSEPKGERASATSAESKVESAASHADAKALQANVGVLGAFMLPAPFSANELADLQKALRTSSEDARRRLERVAARERELDEWEHALEQRNDELQELRRLLERKELDLSLREDEVTRDEKAKAARDAQSWAELAKFFSEGDPSELAKKLALFEPDEAVRILRALDDERASELVNALPADKYHAYLQAYRATKKPE